MISETISQRPYLLRAMHEWMTDNGHTPYVVVDASVADVDVPQQHVREGKIVLNVSYAAAHNLDMSNALLRFDARFGGEARQVRVPMAAVLGVYSRETGQGMIFSDEGDAGRIPGIKAVEKNAVLPDASDPKEDRNPGTGRSSHLRVVK
jgi:stringent starvation protein B